MKKNFFLLLLALVSVGTASAKLNGSGYYRIWNSAVEVNYKERAFCCVTFNTYHVSTAAGTQQDIDAIPLYPTSYAQHSDPAAVIYVRIPDSGQKIDLQAQGVSVSTILNGSTITLSGNNDGAYVLTGQVKGVDSPVYSTSYKKYTDGEGHYILTSHNSNTSYKFWSAAEVDSESDEWYFGVQPTLEANGKYYAPYYVSFPFEPKSEGMKVYYVSSFTDGGYTLTELKGIVPAATPVIIECSSNDPSDNRLTLYAPGTAGTSAPGNCLKGNYFRNPDLGITLYAGAVTQFDPTTMRVWNVENGELVLSTAKDNLKYSEVGRDTWWYCLDANSSYLIVPTTAAATLREGVTVTFDTDGGSPVESVSGKTGTTITLPADPTKEGYTFVGWSGLVETFPETDVTFTALWTPNQYTITFDTDGGSAIAPITQDYGSAVTAPADPTKEGYTFAGWDSEIPATMPLNGATLTALWTPNQYTITFDTDGGSAVAAITQDYGSAVTAPAAPTKEGYTFTGWDNEIPATMPLGGATFKALWQINQYTVRFLMDDGTVLQETTQDYGSAITAPATNPSKTGAEFKGWSPAVDETVPAYDVTYTATFTGNQYTITFDTDGGSEIAPITDVYGREITVPANPTKEGYTFSGWSVEIPSTIPAGNIIIKALWTPNQYTITFDTDGGSEIAPITQDYGSAVTAPADPTKEGYTFAGWDSEIPATMPLDGATLTALWTINQYTITFNTDGGSAISSVTQDYGTAITAPSDPVKTGYTFLGWDNTIPVTMPAENITVTAQWEVAYADYAVTLSNGWNWVSFPMYQEDMSDVATMLSGGEWTSGDEVKTRTHVAAYTKQSDKWVGTLTRQGTLDNTGMYKLKSDKAQTPVVKSNARVLIPSEIDVDVNNGWNHIAFLPAEDMLLSEALANYPASDGDVIKSQDASSLYSETDGWVGDLTVLNAGQGYMLKRIASASVSFRYPDVASEQPSAAASLQRSYRFADNMTVVANVEDIETVAGDSLVAAVGGDVRGSAAIAEDGTLVLTIQGDKAETLSLSLVRDGVVYATAKTALCYESDAVVGSLSSPTAISFVEENTGEASAVSGNVIAIYTVDGIKLNTLNITALSAGAYIVYIEADGKTSVTKITKK